jgi:tetratricopeptide (TPR) repeat protein
VIAVTLSQAFGLLILLALLAGASWAYVQLLKRSEEPGTIVIKTLITLGMVAGFIFFIAPLVAAGGPSAIGGLLITLVLSLIVAILWRHHIIELILRPFTTLFTGGSQPPDPAPFFSIARAKRQQQLFDEAIEEIHHQLERFPDDYSGLMLLAEIQAVNLHDLSGAAETVERVCAAHADRPRQVAGALSTLADWRLQIAHDRDAALALFERIRDTFPNHPVAMDATQRIAHLPAQEMLDQQGQLRTITLKETPKAVIRDRSEVKVELKTETPDEAIARLVGQLEVHPQDRSAREELAGLYAGHLHDASLAVEQLELLLKQPGHEKASIVRWLNLMADYHIRIGSDLKSAEAVLVRIEQRYPGSPAATQASKRKMLLGRELKGNEKSRDVHLGSYERDLGLR